jgi:plasmid stability protein
MSNILIRDVPADVHAKLQERAERDGRSLQQYLINVLRRLAEQPTMDEVLDRIETYSGGRVGLERAAEYLREDRASH